MARRREFDEDALLERSTSLFWEKGYTATSMSDVAAVSGVGNGSIYAAYGSKPELFLLVFERYCAGRVDMVRGAMAEGTDAQDAVASFFEAVIDDCASHQPSWGCLMLNTLAEVGRDWPEVVEVAQRAIAEMERLVDARLALEGVAGDGRALLAAEIVLVSQGLIQFSRIEQEPQRLRDIASSALEHLTPALRAA
ncbi:TetR/AcrR family transcriptional regulator [Leifsonia virtsii]|uniref:TetR/AcrR family transcriptional regulator n=1 Tax=Leifsonia virtsii TaxID=3035915 RepID=A0ABT8J1Q1_9MICO|nr:TetR/AcrR family transcriptional regulator [Leifsonia virtsii]MDN4599016.1 TetR/AcrR family transcriptional regulator [Leifsonia virtsii]